MNFKRTLVALCTLALLAGCANQPIERMQLPADKPVTDDKAASLMSQEWAGPAVSRDGRPTVVLLTPMSLPESVKAKKLSLQLEPGATVSDLVAVLAKLGHSVILADDIAGNKSFFVPKYQGTLGGFLSAVTRVTDVWFTWHEGTIVVSSKERISVSIPQEAGFGDTFSKGIKALGIDESAVTWEAGMATITLTPSQMLKTRLYVKRMAENAALITLQVAVVNVNLDQTVKSGIDWESLNLALGRGARASAANLFTPATPATGAATNTGAGTVNANGSVNPAPLGGATTTVAAVAATTATLLSGGALKALMVGRGFSLGVLFDALQKYGTAETRQNAKLSTAAGKTVELKSLTSIPYVSSIGATTNGTSNNNGSGNVTGSAQTAKADDGIEIKLTPSYSAAANTVTVDFSMSVKAVLAFNELKAGNQLGTLTQPTTAERSFSDTIRLRPGQTVVIGGLSYDSISDNRGLPSFLSPGNKLESQSLKLTRQTMFVVIRPSVEVLGGVDERSDSDEFLPAGTPLADEPSLEQEPAPASKAKQLAKVRAIVEAAKAETKARATIERIKKAGDPSVVDKRVVAPEGYDSVSGKE